MLATIKKNKTEIKCLSDRCQSDLHKLHSDQFYKAVEESFIYWGLPQSQVACSPTLEDCNSQFYSLG